MSENWGKENMYVCIFNFIDSENEFKWYSMDREERRK